MKNGITVQIVVDVLYRFVCGFNYLPVFLDISDLLKEVLCSVGAEVDLDPVLDICLCPTTFAIKPFDLWVGSQWCIYTCTSPRFVRSHLKILVKLLQLTKYLVFKDLMIYFAFK